ncbi:MAG: hypothetical protein K5945_04655 [Bacteroidaceae bacterium]|nr:hypothetical protein [Bacteroidaceae bacterium]
MSSRSSTATSRMEEGLSGIRQQDVAEVLAHFQETEPRGEFVIVVGGCPDTH